MRILLRCAELAELKGARRVLGNAVRLKVGGCEAVLSVRIPLLGGLGVPLRGWGWGSAASPEEAWRTRGGSSGVRTSAGIYADSKARADRAQRTTSSRVGQEEDRPLLLHHTSRTMSTLAPYLTSAAEEGGNAPSASTSTTTGSSSRLIVKKEPCRIDHELQYRMWGATIGIDTPCRVQPSASYRHQDGRQHYRITNVSLVEESSGTPSSVCRVINQGLFELSVTPITYGPCPTVRNAGEVADYLKRLDAAEESQERSALEEDRLVICTIAPGESRTINITFNYEVPTLV